MSKQSRRPLPPRPERGSVITTVCLVLGICVILFGLLMLAVGVSFAVDDDEMGLAIFCAAAGLIPIVAGILLIVLPRRSEAARAKGSDGTATKSGPSGVEIVSRQPIAGGTAPATGAPTSAPAPVPAPAPAPVAPAPAPANAAPAGDAPKGAEDVASMVMRSHDVYATLRDLVRHEMAGNPSPQRHLASMLEGAGLMAWEGAPTCEAGRLTRNGHFWVRQSTDDISEEDYDRLISIEAALSVNQDLSRDASQAPAAYQTVAELAGTVPARVLAAMSAQSIRPYDLTESLGAAYPGTDPADTPGEWRVRASFASCAECAVTPFRVTHDHRANVAEGLLVASLEVPRPACMAILSPDATQQAALARSYALRLAVLLAGHMLALPAGAGGERPVREVIVNCHEHGSDETLLSLDLTPALVQGLTQVLADGDALMSGFPAHEGVRAQFGPTGWFVPVEPFMTFDDPRVSPRARFTYPELVGAETSERLRAVTGARTVAELGINENAGRLAAWDGLAAAPWASTEEAVSRLVAMRDTSADITVSEACNRTVGALLDGSVDAQDTEAIHQLFVGGTTLEVAVRRAEAALDETDGPDHPEEAVRALTEALAPIEALGAYLDDEGTVYRYFGSIAERIRFDLDLDDHRREVRLVPDAYFNALSNLSIAHDELGEFDKALRYAEEMVRIAPASIHATMRKVRVLEHQSRVYEAADLIKAILRFASTPRDASICHYRLAFMEWKLGRSDLAVACYQRALTWDTEMASQAREELDDLLGSDEGLRRLTDDEAAALLAREGIPLGCDESDRRRLLASAALCTDEGVFWAARPLVGILFGMSGDDVIMGIYRSLAPVE